MYGICPLCKKPVLVGHTLKLIRDEGKVVVHHYNCSEPTIERDTSHLKPFLSLSEGGKH